MSTAAYQRLLSELANQFPRPDGKAAVEREIVAALERHLEGSGSANEMPWLTAALAATPDWNSPRWRSGLDPQPTLASIISGLLALARNPNLVSEASAGGCAAIERRAASIVAEWVGYDPDQADGVFTFGGAGGMLYGVKLGLEKAVPGAAARGLRQDVTVIASEQCHACCETAAAWLGIGAVHVIRAPSAADGSVQIAAIERAAREALASGRPVAAIVATLGSTDSFALDDLAAIAALAERLAHEFQLPSPPHVHADAVIGWPWSTFNDYDFQANPLQFAAATLAALTTARERIERLKLADSIGVDFHKTGFTPYISSLFLVRDRVDFTRLALPSDHAPYLYRSGEQHPGLFTLETSRSAIGALGAMANLSALDKQGYRVLIGHAVELTQRLRTRLGAEPRVAVLNERNVGFMTLFRVYPRGVDAHAALDRELCDPSYNERLAAHNQFNQQLFADSHAAAANGDGIALALTNIHRRGASGEPILALRAGTLSPFMGEHHLKAIVAQLLVD